MRIVVCVKQVYDPKTVKISRSREELDLRDAAKILNPPDKYALAAALRLREAAGAEVIALTVGGPDAEDVAHEAVAIGAGSRRAGIRVRVERCQRSRRHPRARGRCRQTGAG